jgi:alpha-ketoglutarate-dependent taurine dioxygenase
MTTTSIGTKLGLRKITARIGAEVTGVSPSLELDPGTVTAIRAALSEHKALVFRGIDVDDDGQQRFANYFGPLTSAHPTGEGRAAAEQHRHDVHQDLVNKPALEGLPDRDGGISAGP